MEEAEAALDRAGRRVGNGSSAESSEAVGWSCRLPRAVVVWCAFLAASAGVVGFLQALGPAHRSIPVRTASTAAEAPAGALERTEAAEAPRAVSRALAPVARWRAIVVYDSGSPAGDTASLERRHSRAGLAGLGYHFVIGNGQGMDDGQVVAGYRWDHQLPGAHAVAGMAMNAGAHGPLDADALNRSAIAVCIVGNTDRRAPTEAQLRALRALIRSLCAEFGIAREHVRFRAELGTTGGAVGEFPLPSFRAGLAP